MRDAHFICFNRLQNQNHRLNKLTTTNKKSEGSFRLWNTIVDRITKKNTSYPNTINLCHYSSLSILNPSNYKPRRRKKKKVDEYITIMGNRLNTSSSKTKHYHNPYPKLQLTNNDHSSHTSTD